MRRFLEQLPTLVGVLVGALATYGATAAAERARWRRGQSVRWDEKRLDAYEEYAHALKQVISIALRLAALPDAHPDGGWSLPEDDLAALEVAEEHRTMGWEAVLLLGSNEVVIAARKWHQSAFELQRLAYGKPGGASLAQTISAISEARRTFYEVAKRDIGIDVGASPEAYEWQLSTFAGADLGETEQPTWYRGHYLPRE
jgi:hypothetical protein